MNPLTPNSKTGFLESPKKGFSTLYGSFDSNAKVTFLKLVDDCIKRRSWPTIDSLCENIGITTRTFLKHLQEDELFNQEWMERKERLKSMYTEKLAFKADTKMGTLANLAMLRYLETGSWNPESRVQFISDNSSPRKLADAAGDVIDAELVPNPHLIANKPTDNTQITSDNTVKDSI